MTNLVGIGGYAGSGKDTVAEYLVANYGFTRAAFADKMRKALLALDPIILQHVTVYEDKTIKVTPERLSELVAEFGWDAAKRQFPEVRRLLQKFGTEAGRDIHGEDCWINALFDENWSERLVIPDCRFENELKAIRSRDGVLLWVERPGVGPVNSHSSDNSVEPDDFDRVIYNSGSIEDLHYSVDRLMEVL